MDPVSTALAAKIASVIGPPAGRWLWQKVRTAPEADAFLRVSAMAIAESAIAVERGINPARGRSVKDEWFQETVGVLTGLLTSALDIDDLVNKFFLEPIATGGAPATKDLPIRIIDRFCENGGDPSTATLPVQEIAEKFVIVLPRLLWQEAARPGSPLAGFAIISSLSQIKAQFDRTIIHPYEQMMEAAKLLSSSSPTAMELALSMLSDVMKNDQQYQQSALDVLCAFLTTSRLPTDDYQWIRIQVAVEELIMEVIPLADKRRAEGVPNLNLNLTGARMLNLNLTGRQVDRLTLDGATIYGNTLLTGTRIRGAASFKETQFYGITNFERASFEGLVAFVQAKFYCGVTFEGAHFSKAAGFQSAVFEDDLLIGAELGDQERWPTTTFDSDLTFYDIGCGGRAMLNDVTCRGSLTMSGSSLLDVLSLEDGHFLKGLAIKDVSTLGSVTLERAHVIGELHLSFAEVSEVNLGELRAGASEDVYVDEVLAVSWHTREKDGRSVFSRAAI